MEANRKLSLFREEAVQEQARRLEGSVVFAQPVAARVAVPVLAALMLAVAAFLGLAEYARTESAAGYVTPSAGMSSIVPPRAGVVTRLAVAVGDSVAAGQLLMEVASGSTLASGAGLESSVRETLLAQRAELEAEVTTGEALFAQQQAERRQRAAGLQLQLQQLDEMERLAGERAAITADRQQRFARLLAKGFASRDQYQAKRDESLGLEREQRDLRLSRLRLTAELAQLRAESAAAPRQQQEKQAEQRMRLAELESRLREVESRSSYAIQSPVAGRVAALQAHAGTGITPDAPVAVILPEGAMLEAQLLIPSRAAGMIELGQPVDFQYAAFPHEKFGVGHGRITHIETSILGPAELKGPVAVQEPVYRVTAALDDQEVRAFGRAYPLQPGMLLDARIVLEKRSLLEWIFEPLYSLRATPQTASES